MDAELLQELDGARGRTSRSQFVREAIAEKLKEMGFKISDALVFPPDRVSINTRVSGKGHKVSQKIFTDTSSALAGKDAKGPKGKRGRKGTSK